MCQTRKQSIYKAKYICIPCKKAFKDSGVNLPFHKDEVKRIGPKKCPQCSGVMREVSRDFRPPRRLDKRRWLAVEQMTKDSGGCPFHTHGCGCCSGRVISQSKGQRRRLLADRPA